MKQNNYFDENGRHYFTEEELQALKDLRDCLMESHRQFWEEHEKKYGGKKEC